MRPRGQQGAKRGSARGAQPRMTGRGRPSERGSAARQSARQFGGPTARGRAPARGPGVREERGGRGPGVREERGGRGPGVREERAGRGPSWRTKPRNAKTRKEQRPRWPATPAAERAVRSVEAILDRQPWSLLEPLLVRAGAEIGTTMARLRAYAKLLLEWNRGYSNLISRNDEGRIVERHLAESLEPAHWLKDGGHKRWLDLGSGGGLPAVPLILVGVGESWTLVESRRNKTLFLRKVTEELGFTGVSVELGRLEMLEAPEEVTRLGRFDGFTSRATMKLGPTLALAARWVVPGGAAYLWKGSRMQEEVEQDASWERSWRPDGGLGLRSGPTVVARFVRTDE